MIELKNISKQYQSKNKIFKAVDNVSLRINDGDVFGIIGYSGAGKSSLVRIINQLTKQTSGDVVIDNVILNQLNKQELRLKQREIGMVFQHFNLLANATVYENVRLPLEINKYPKEQRKAKVDKILELVGLKDKANSYPSQLSGGQKQRVGIARALVNDPKILLCDEATSALDPQTTKEILQLLAELNTKLKLTMVVISHELDVIRRICNKVAIMQEGRIIEQNSVEEIFSNPQQELTRNFVKDQDDFEDLDKIESELKNNNPNGTIIKLTFVGNSHKPIVSSLAIQYNLNVSILYGNIEQVNQFTIGKLIIYIDKEKQELNDVFKFIEHQQVKWEVI
ncbi:methionine ABC transporter ATP-binding protein [Mycoplasma sp. P36-A1]|uniref:methionine ABC transporter ATP-binding protein n=1 Tax=Mycoplasma sp. P36-A1 TaxID=3252900 RepID=UPI003C3087CE